MGSDGIRVKDGMRMTLTYTTTAGFVLRERIQVVVQQFLRDVGIEVKIKNYRVGKMFGGCAKGGITATRQFDF